jgi:hypothetical protein
VESIRFRSQPAARRPKGDSDASLWRLEVRAERFYEARVGERLGVEARGLRRRGNQNFRRESLLVVENRAGDPVRCLG